MLRGLWKLTLLEIKIFLREPLGLLGTVGMPVIVFLLMGRLLGGRRGVPADVDPELLILIPVVGAILIALGAVQSLVTIIAIYRESGILKRLRATPLRPFTILSAQVLVKLLLTALTIAVMLAAGRRFVPAGSAASVFNFAAALLVTTLSILSIGFVIASVVPTARFAQPVASLIFYPMMALALVPTEVMPLWLRALARAMPLTYAVSLMRGVIAGEPWSAHLADLASLAVVFAAGTLVSSKIFRWQ